MNLGDAMQAYFEAFQVEPPMPIGIADERIAEVLMQAVERGEPLPEDYDWWELPPEAVA